MKIKLIKPEPEKIDASSQKARQIPSAEIADTKHLVGESSFEQQDKANMLISSSKKKDKQKNESVESRFKQQNKQKFYKGPYGKENNELWGKIGTAYNLC